MTVDEALAFSMGLAYMSNHVQDELTVCIEFGKDPSSIIGRIFGLVGGENGTSLN